MMSKTFFRIFKKIKSLALSGIGVKRKFLWSFNILWKRHVWEKSGSQKVWFSSCGQNWLSTNGFQEVFFDHQYFINRLISDFDFWNVDRDEWQKLGLSTGFLKNFRWGKLAHFGSKNDASSQPWVCCKNLLKIWDSEMGQ